MLRVCRKKVVALGQASPSSRSRNGVRGLWSCGWTARGRSPRVPALVVYVRMAKVCAGGLTESEKLRLALNFRYPAAPRVLGLAETRTHRLHFGYYLLAAASPDHGGRSNTVTVLIAVLLMCPACCSPVTGSNRSAS